MSFSTDAEINPGNLVGGVGGWVGGQAVKHEINSELVPFSEKPQMS